MSGHLIRRRATGGGGGGGGSNTLTTTVDGQPYVTTGRTTSVGFIPPRPLTGDPLSVLRRKLDVSQALAADSATTVSNWVTQTGWTDTSTPHCAYGGIYNFEAGNAAPTYRQPMWEVPAGTPLVKVWSRRNKGSDFTSSGTVLTLQQLLDQGVPMPDPAIAGTTIQPAGTDGSALIRQGNKLWSFWILRPMDYSNPSEVAGGETGTVPPGYAWVCEQGGVIADMTTTAGAYGPAGWGVNAAGMLDWGSKLSIDDWINGIVPHIISMSIPLTGGPGYPANNWTDNYVLPAVRADVFNFTGNDASTVTAYRVPEGTRFRLPATFDETAITAYLNTAYTYNYGGGVTHSYTPLQAASSLGTGTGPTAAPPLEIGLRMVLRAIRDYGLIITDSSGNYGMAVESTQSVGTPYSAHATDPSQWGNIPFVIQTVFSQFQKVAPVAANAYMT